MEVNATKAEQLPILRIVKLGLRLARTLTPIMEGVISIVVVSHRSNISGTSILNCLPLAWNSIHYPSRVAKYSDERSLYFSSSSSLTKIIPAASLKKVAGGE